MTWRVPFKSTMIGDAYVNSFFTVHLILPVFASKAVSAL